MADEASAGALPAPDALFENAACGLLLTDADGSVLRANATFCAWLGLVPADLVGKTRFQSLLTMGGKVFHQTHWSPLLQMQGSVAEMKLDLVHRDGHAVPVLVNAVRRRHGQRVCDELAVLVVRDRHLYERELIAARARSDAELEARRELQKALEESRNVLGLAMRSARMGVWSRDIGTDTVWWSRELEELFGLPEGGFGGTRAHFRELVHEADRSKLVDAVSTALERHEDYTVEFRIRHASGAWRWMEGRGRGVYDADGTPVKVYGLGIDITERKQAEAVVVRQAAIFEHLSDAIVITDLTGRIKDFNPGCERMLGYRASEVLGRPVSMLHRPEDAERLGQAALAGITERGEWRGEMVFVRKDGSQGICESVVKPLADAAGQVYAAVAVNRDVTLQRRVDSELRHLNRQLSAADRRKDEFLATLAHELRNPLAPIRSMLELLHQKPLVDPDLLWIRDVLERQIRQLTHLVDDLLEVSRITQGKLELRLMPVDIATVVKGAVEAAQPLIDAAAHTLAIRLPDDAPLVVEADLTRLTQVIVNLLNNAVKYTPSGGRIELEAFRESDDAVIRVRDSGIGLAADHLVDVFEMFSQVAPALERSKGGLGIGLALVKGLLELHGGSVSAASEGAGRGSEFTLRIPVSAKPLATPPDVPAPGAEPWPAPKQRILVIDDNEDAAESLAAVLRMLGHVVTVAHDAASGLQVAETFSPRLVLLDIGLPLVNGYEVARRIRASEWGRSMQIVAVTGWGQEHDKRAATDAGFDRHLTKPVDMDLLASILDAAAGAAPAASTTAGSRGVQDTTW